jgi:glycosyltransferase involved in cell wall biosynthesis
MLANEDIIYVSNDWRAENKTSGHHICEVLARNNRILYVEAAGQRAPRASTRDARKIFRKMRQVWKKPERVEPNIFLYSPVVIPLHRFALVRQLNRLLLGLLLRRATRAIGFKTPIVWIFMPHFGAIADAVPSKAVVYYVTDQYSSHPDVNPIAITLMENSILRRADVVFAVSDALVAKKKPLNANTHLSLHGVDVSTFQRALLPETVVPDDIALIRRPIAGFFGLIEEWIDLDLLRFLGEKMPDVSFVLIGHAAQNVSILRGLPNVHLLGHKPFETLPGYLKAFDVGLLPYKRNEQVLNCNPKKLREYMAAGTPVVSVRFTEVERYRDYVYIADSYEEYAAHIRTALVEPTDRKQRRVDAMKGESWEHRVALIGRRVEEAVAARAAARR